MGLREKSKNGKKTKQLTVEEASAKAKKQVIAVLVMGVVLLIADIAVSFSQTGVEVVKTAGKLYMIRPGTGQEAGRVSLTARVPAQNGTIEKKMGVTLEPYSEKGDDDEDAKENDDTSAANEQELIETELRGIASDMNSDTTLLRVELPDSLETGEKISWEIEQRSESNAVAIAALTGIIIFCIYRQRFAGIRKLKQENAESVIRQLPEFVNRLVLLLNAGLVLTSAFEKSVEESFRSDKDEDFFYGRLREIYISCKTANGSMHRELKAMAKECGVRELMRVSNIISDNIQKGVELTDKLQSESEILWMARKKNCEEKGRIAETKLTLPLMIFLMSLILITVAPALLEL